MTVNIYVWWAPGDEAHRDTLVDTWLRPLSRDQSIRVYDEQTASPGVEAKAWRRKAASGAMVFLALVTQRLVAAPAYDYLVEALNGNNTVVLLPILVSPAVIEGTVFKGRIPSPNELATPEKLTSRSKTIVDYQPHDAGWVLVGDAIRKLVTDLASRSSGDPVFLRTTMARDGSADLDDDINPSAESIDGEVIMQPEQIGPREGINRPAALGVGSRLSGRYKLLDQASRQAGTSVFPAWDMLERQMVRLHLLDAGVAGSSPVREGILDRVEAWSHLKGTSVVPVLEPRLRDGSRWYFVSALDDGATLLDLLLRDGISDAAVVPLMVKLATDLEDLHRQGYVHGNVRPQEVFIHRDGQLQLGAPHPLVGVDLTGPFGEVMGPRSGYWAPELNQPPQAVIPADPRTDVYGIALTAAVTMATSDPLGRSPGEPVAIVDGLSCDKELKRVLRRALSASPADRHPTMEELRRDLVRAHRATRGSASIVELVEVPAGRIHMVWELPGHVSSAGKRAQWAAVGAFSLGKYPVTQSQYESVMGVNPSATVGPDHPVTRVSFRDALELCNRLSVLDGLDPVYSYRGGRVCCRWEADGYRLPTEAEWELAARGEGGRMFAWGDDAVGPRACWNGDDNDLGTRNRTGTCAVNMHPLGATPPQSAAPDSCLWDMTGNVWEWCWDYFGSYPGVEGKDELELDNPIGPEHPEVPIVPNPSPGALNRILRGGSWKDVEERWMRASARNTDDERVRADGVGFRVARGARRRGA